MGKIVIMLGVLSLFLYAEKSNEQDHSFQSTCLSCHQQQQIPSSLMYKRYLMKYSTRKGMEEAMFRYMKDPKKENSIMPAPFFLKFPMKENISLSDTALRKYIQAYLELFDIKKKLMVEDMERDK